MSDADKDIYKLLDNMTPEERDKFRKWRERKAKVIVK